MAGKIAHSAIEPTNVTAYTYDPLNLRNLRDLRKPGLEPIVSRC